MTRLAIDGGEPVRKTMLPYGRHVVDESDIQAVAEVLRSEWLTTGPKVQQFEEEFAEYVGAKHAVAVSSGTAALHAAAFAAGLGPGDEAITTPLSFVASANCILYQGARPAFADIERDTLNIDPALVEEKITSRTKALIPVDFAGQPSDLDDINDIAKRHRLVVIEDAAHALGATYKGQRVGSLATMTVFSTHAVKHITTGEGGVVTTDNTELAKRLRIFRNHGITSETRERQGRNDWYYEMVVLGYNYRLSDIQCALGLTQLRNLSTRLDRRRTIASEYDEAFRGSDEIAMPVVRPDRESAWHLYVIQFNLNKLRVGRTEVFKALRAENIGVNVHYIPIPWQPYYRKLGYEKGQWPVAEDAYERLTTLPIFPAMTNSDINDTIQAVKKVIKAYSVR